MQGEFDVLFLGGDRRSLGIAGRLLDNGLRVAGWHMQNQQALPLLRGVEDWRQALPECRAVVLPMPAFDAQLRLCKADDQTLSSQELFEAVGDRVPVFGGRLSLQVATQASEYGVRIIDYHASETVQVQNAVLTAEGAIFVAMQHLDVSIWGTRVAVLGYGRIGEALTSRLQALGATVHVGARKERDLARIAVRGATPLDFRFRDWTEPLVSGQYAAVFNTVPYRLMDDGVLARIPKQTVLIELASAPGGWEARAPHSCRIVDAPGLPALYAPRTAGELLADEILKVWKGGILT